MKKATQMERKLETIKAKLETIVDYKSESNNVMIKLKTKSFDFI